MTERHDADLDHDEVIEDEEDQETVPPPVDAATFKSYLKQHIDDMFCEPVTIENVVAAGEVFRAEVYGEAGLIDDCMEKREYLHVRKDRYVSAVRGSGKIRDLNFTFEGLIKTMGDVVDVPDVMDIILWAGQGAPPPDVVAEFDGLHNMRVIRQRFDDVRNALRSLDSQPGHDIGTVLREPGYAMIDTISELNNLLSRNMA